MHVRRRQTGFRPTLDILPSRIVPSVYGPVECVPMGSGDQGSADTSYSVTQSMPSDTSDMVGPGY